MLLEYSSHHVQIDWCAKTHRFDYPRVLTSKGVLGMKLPTRTTCNNNLPGFETIPNHIQVQTRETDLVTVFSRRTSWTSRTRKTYGPLHSITSCWALRTFFTLYWIMTYYPVTWQCRTELAIGKSPTKYLSIHQHQGGLMNRVLDRNVGQSSCQLATLRPVYRK